MSNDHTRYLAITGLLAAMATLLMFLELPLPLMPVFLKMDISELPAIVAAFTLGPLAAVLVDLIKNLLHAANTQTMGIGECANFLIGAAFLIPVGCVYRHRADYRGAIMALALGTVSMVVWAALLNYFIFLPLYQVVLHFPLGRMVALGTAANPYITDLKTFIILAIAPFNALKGLIVSLLALGLYRKVQPWLRAEWPRQQPTEVHRRLT